MELIKELLDKYWKGDTTLDEEQIIRDYYQKKGDRNSVESKMSYEPYFAEIQRRKQIKYKGELPGRQFSLNRRWLSIAATLIIGITAGAVTLQQSLGRDPFLVEDPVIARDILKQAFQSISTNLDEGKKHSLKINKINKTSQILITN